MKIVLSKESAKTLIELRDNKAKARLEKAIDELEAKGLRTSNIEKLTGSKYGYRKRVGRYRIIFTVHKIQKIIYVWIIEIKKDSKKDYRKWLDYIKFK
jgi:mRNA-degrading endonuclease RelE of RelBE toxin-antitoxin system